jgi:hypothetical protein
LETGSLQFIPNEFDDNFEFHDFEFDDVLEFHDFKFHYDLDHHAGQLLNRSSP